MKLKIIAILAILILIVSNVNAQGCSDAGVCTINSFKPHHNDTVKVNKNQIKFGTSFGSADKSILTLGNYIEYNRQVSKKMGFDAKITSLYQDGNGISNFGLSDLYINGNYNAKERIKFVFGLKIPLTNGNIKKDNISLPMDYQSSLGTFDLILGTGFEIKKVQLVLAYQQPLSQNNNEFDTANYIINSKFNDFQSTNKFKRSGDVLLRVSYPFFYNNKLKITPSILPIFHLTNDKYTNALGIENDIIGSQGLTLNGNVYLDYKMNNKSAFQVNLGMPFVVRKSRPDGLTRGFVINLEYKINF